MSPATTKACERIDVELPDALRIAVSNTVGSSWQLDLTSAAIAADPDAWTDQPAFEAEPGLGALLALGSLIGPVVRYRQWDDDGLADVSMFTPSDESWKRFEQALDRLGVWGWETSPSTGSVEGGAWEVSILWRRRRIEINGIGAWPPHGTTVPGIEWAGFMKAIHRFAGGRGFLSHS